MSVLAESGPTCECGNVLAVIRTTQRGAPCFCSVCHRPRSTWWARSSSPPEPPAAAPLFIRAQATERKASARAAVLARRSSRVIALVGLVVVALLVLRAVAS